MCWAAGVFCVIMNERKKGIYDMIGQRSLMSVLEPAWMSIHMLKKTARMEFPSENVLWLRKEQRVQPSGSWNNKMSLRAEGRVYI